MSLVDLIIDLVVVGLVLYIISLLPIDAEVKRIIHIVVLVVICLWLLQAFGILHGVQIGRLR
jgi:uncharacterized membrane protein